MVTYCVGAAFQNTFLKRIKGKMEGTGKRERRREQLLDNLKEKKKCWNLKEEALDRILWITRSGRGYGPVVRQTT